MNRRDFIRQSLLGAFGLSLPIELSAALTIVEVKVLDDIQEVLTFGETGIKDGHLIVNVELEKGKVWDYARLVDSDDREWHTTDEGETWHCGLMSFSLAMPSEV